MTGRRLPALDDENRWFWTSGAEGVLRFLRCGSCGSWQHPPTPVCRSCYSSDVSPQPVAGIGTVARFTVNHQAWRPDLTEPYVIAAVALDEDPGLILTTNIVGCAPDDVHTGLRVEVRLLPADDGSVDGVDSVWIPQFTPLPEPEGTS